MNLQQLGDAIEVADRAWDECESNESAFDGEQGR